MRAGWVSEAWAIEWLHRFKNLLAYRRCGGVVEIDRGVCHRGNLAQPWKNFPRTSHNFGKNRWEIVFCRYFDPRVPPVPVVPGPMIRSTSWTCRNLHIPKRCGGSVSSAES